MKSLLQRLGITVVDEPLPPLVEPAHQSGNVLVGRVFNAGGETGIVLGVLPDDKWYLVQNFDAAGGLGVQRIVAFADLQGWFFGDAHE